MLNNPDELVPLVSDIWSSMLGLDLEVGPPAAIPVTTRSLTGVVQISGDWHGAVTVKCSSPAAHSYAAAMFGMDVDELSVEEVCDALGELTNMTGGSVKALVAGDCSLSIPTVTEGLDYRTSIPRAVVLHELGFVCDGDPIEVTVFEIKP